MPFGPRRYRIDDIRSRFQTVALDNTYQVYFDMNSYVVNAAKERGIDQRFLTEDLGLYVSDAVLPGSSFGDIEVAGDRQGITERVAFSRIYDDVTFSFYVDRDYKVLKLFESWIELVNPLSGSQSRNSQVMRLNYPDTYKCGMKIYKFNKDRFSRGPQSANELEFDSLNRISMIGYNFFRAWPYSIASTPVNYNGSNVLQCNVTFRYDRYIVDNVTINRSSNVTPESIAQQQALFEQNLLESTGGGIALTGAGTAQELFEINNLGGTFGGPTQGETPGAFQGNFNIGVDIG